MTKDEIREIRKSLDLTQTAFAMKLGVTVDAVRKWEGEAGVVPSPRIEALIRGLEKEAVS